MADSFGSFRIYPRGFLGAELGMRIEKKPKPFEAQLNSLQNDVSLFQPQVTTVDANPNVEQLYAQYVRRTPDCLSFEFRKKVLIVAMAAFGTPSFVFWYRLQHRSPAAGDLHLRFLEDTLRYIRTGRREQPLETWQALLTITDAGERQRLISEAACEFFGLPSHGFNRFEQNSTLVEIIQKWCSQENGIEDLLGTLHVLFGNL